jgi:hypothetical protein
VYRTGQGCITHLPKVLLEEELVCSPLCDWIASVNVVEIGVGTTSKTPWETISSARNSERQGLEDNQQAQAYTSLNFSTPEEERGNSTRIELESIQDSSLRQDGKLGQSGVTAISSSNNDEQPDSIPPPVLINDKE